MRIISIILGLLMLFVGLMACQPQVENVYTQATPTEYISESKQAEARQATPAPTVEPTPKFEKILGDIVFKTGDYDSLYYFGDCFMTYQKRTIHAFLVLNDEAKTYRRVDLVVRPALTDPRFEDIETIEVTLVEGLNLNNERRNQVRLYMHGEMQHEFSFFLSGKGTYKSQPLTVLSYMQNEFVVFEENSLLVQRPSYCINVEPIHKNVTLIKQ